MLFIGITELEEAINYWRSQSPSIGDTLQLSPHVTALSKPYALLIIQGAQRLTVDHLDADALIAWQSYKNAIQKL
jgi:hypothetical protein